MTDEPERPTASAPVPPAGVAREAIDARDLPTLADDPGCVDGQVEVALDETFPASDPVASSRSGSNEPVASSGFPAS